MTDALSLERVVVQFPSGTRALDGVSLHVELGRSHALLGGNGSGKTSLLNAVCGYYSLSAGSISVGGRDIGSLRSHQRAAIGIGRSLQSVATVDDLTPREYVALGFEGQSSGRYLRRAFPTPAQVRSNGVQLRRAGELLANVDLETYADLRLRDCPYGVRKFVDVVRVFAGSPSIVLLDEPTSGVSSSERDMLADLLLGEIGRREVCLILVDHDIEFVRRLCATATVLASGKVIADGSLVDVLQEPDVIETFVGTAT